MRKILVVVDMQNDFIDGTLGTPEAVAIVENVKNKIRQYDTKDIFVTMDTHHENYLETQEGKNLPVKHCIKETKGWKIREDIAALLKGAKVFEKETFGSVKLAKEITRIAEKEEIEIELVGLCTDFCVLSNAVVLKASVPEVKISVDAACCAGASPENHQKALDIMKNLHIKV